MLPIISWKNVWRNKTRSLVVIVAMMIGVFSGSFIIALSIGMVDTRSQDIINNQSAQIQIHNPNYSDYQEIQYVIDNVSSKVDSIKAISGVKDVTCRYRNMVMSQTGSQRGAFFVNAIDLNTDTAVFDIYKKLTRENSSYFEDDIRNPILISEALAYEHQLETYVLDSAAFDNFRKRNIPEETLAKMESIKGETFKKKKQFAIKLKEILSEEEYFSYKARIFKSCSQFKLKRKIELSVYSYSKENIPETYRVVGFYKTTDGIFDGMNAFVLADDFRKHAALPENSTHEICITLHSKEVLGEVKQKLIKMFPDLKVEEYRELKPEVAMNEDMMSVYTIMIMGIILFALAFGIINTMLMAVLERTKEIGMLKAIGMNKKRVFLMIMYETVYLGLVGGFVGMVLGYLTIKYFEVSGIDLAMFQEGFEAMGYSSILYPKFEPEMFVQITILVVIAGILSAIVPARRAIKLNPAEAVRSDV